MSILDDMDHEAKMSNWEDQPIMVRVRELERKLEAERERADKAEAEHRAWALTANARMADAVKLAAEHVALARKLAEVEQDAAGQRLVAEAVGHKLAEAVEVVADLLRISPPGRLTLQAADIDRRARAFLQKQGNVALARDPKRDLTP